MSMRTVRQCQLQEFRTGESVAQRHLQSLRPCRNFPGDIFLLHCKRGLPLGPDTRQRMALPQVCTSRYFGGGVVAAGLGAEAMSFVSLSFSFFAMSATDALLSACASCVALSVLA